MPYSPYKPVHRRLPDWQQAIWFIEGLYLKRFGLEQPAVVLTIEERAKQEEAKKAARKLARGGSPRGRRP